MKICATHFLRRLGSSVLLGSGLACGSGPGVDLDGEDGTTGEDTSEGEPALRCASWEDPGARVEVPVTVTGDVIWGCGEVHVLTGVHVVENGTLRIEPGTTVLAEPGSALMVVQGARLYAEGTAAHPIVMTSALPPSARSPGDWGGLYLAGEAPTNETPSWVDLPERGPEYGGTDAEYDCGTLRYLRVEWSGAELSPGRELAGITLAGCGAQTAVDHVQVHGGADDGLEIRGGQFDLHHVIVTGALDDALDLEEGFRGQIQHALLVQDPRHGHFCVEASSNSSRFDAEPRSAPMIANMSCVGSGPGGSDSQGVILKEGTAGGILSSLIVGTTRAALTLAHQATQEQLEAGQLPIDGLVICDDGPVVVEVRPEDPDPATWSDQVLTEWLSSAGANHLGASCMLTSTTWGSIDARPAAASLLATAGVPLSGGLEPTAYAGAVDPEGPDWTAEPWVEWLR